MFLRRLILSTLLIVPATLFAADSKVAIKSTPVIYTPATSGPEMFKAYCASCHGTDAKGHGPAAPALKAAPHDLTMLSRNNHGKFPVFSVEAAIRGDSNVLSHGSKDMPVWGVVLGSLGNSMGNGTKPELELRIRNLRIYVESLQQK